MMMRALGVVALVGILGSAAFFLVREGREEVAYVKENTPASSTAPLIDERVVPSTSEVLVASTTPTPAPTPFSSASSDIEPQKPLSTPPSPVKAVYLTGWSGGSTTKINQIIALLKRTELNAVVIDVKDYSGLLSYPMDFPEAIKSGANAEPRIARPNAMIKAFHDNGIYVIARVTAFQDPIFAKAHPEWALQNKHSSSTWLDSKGLAWMDPATKQVWDYIVAIAKDTLARGFDEVNFDYVRFASDGDLGGIRHPTWDEKEPRHSVIKRFFAYLRESLPLATLSADLFGLATTNRDDLGIGQVIEDAYLYFDYVSPMTYPSHYASGFIGIKNPAAHPYEVIQYSMQQADRRLTTLRASNSAVRAKLRPWFQDFTLGATYDATKVRDQIRAWDEVVASSTNPSGGWFLWNASNRYTEGALLPEGN